MVEIDSMISQQGKEAHSDGKLGQTKVLTNKEKFKFLLKEGSDINECT